MMTTTREKNIIAILKTELQPTHLTVINESKFHHVPKDSETHFKVVIVSTEFEDKKLIERHKRINSLLAEELVTGLHALSIHAYTPEEWTKKSSKTRPSPHCRDGFDK